VLQAVRFREGLVGISRDRYVSLRKTLLQIFMLVWQDALIVPVCFWNLLPFVFAAREDAAMVNNVAYGRTRRKNAQNGRRTTVGGRRSGFQSRSC